MKRTYIASILCLLTAISPLFALAETLPETEVSTNALSTPTTSALPRTFAYLSYVVDNLATMLKNKNVGDDPERFCGALVSSFITQADDDRASFAWKAESYALPEDVTLGVTQKDIYTKARDIVQKTSNDLVGLTPDVTDDFGIAANRVKAIFRSFLIEAVSEFRKAGGPDSDRVNTLLAFDRQVIPCIESTVAKTDANNKIIETLKSDLSNIESLWNDNKTYLIQGDQVPEATPLSVTITRKDLKAETDATPTLEDASKVVTLTDLRLFAETMMRKDERIKKVSMDEKMTALDYAIDAKFLGVFKSYLLEHIFVDHTGNVTARLPWYSFLMKKGENYKSPVALAASVKAAIPAPSTTTSNPSAFIALESKILDALKNALAKTDVPEDVNVDTTTDAI